MYEHIGLNKLFFIHRLQIINYNVRVEGGQVSENNELKLTVGKYDRLVELSFKNVNLLFF